MKDLHNDIIVDEYANDARKCRPIITRALQKATEYCQKYLDKKEDLAYLSYFRKKVNFT